MEGKAVIFSAPSGAGKTTIVRHLLEQNLNLEFSISACSRSKREGEVNGKDYYFLTVDEFKKRIDENAFLEWEEVYTDNFYGTLKSEVQRVWDNGHHLIFDVDVIGGLNLKKFFGDHALAIFVEPPSVEVLEQRLRSRATETEESVARRIGKAHEEMQVKDQFDFVLLNDELSKACKLAYEKVNSFLQK